MASHKRNGRRMVDTSPRTEWELTRVGGRFQGDPLARDGAAGGLPVDLQHQDLVDVNPDLVPAAHGDHLRAVEADPRPHGAGESVTREETLIRHCSSTRGCMPEHRALGLAVTQSDLFLQRRLVAWVTLYADKP